MPVFYDQLKRMIEIPHTPLRIISTVPSQTELLFDLGLDEKIIGITQFCIHPAANVKPVTKIGGTKKLNTGLIKTLYPDFVIANKEENDRGQIDELMRLYPVWVSDINTLAGAIDMIESIGGIFGCHKKAKKLTEDIAAGFNQLNTIKLPLRVAYLIWRKPYMAAGADTFIDNMLQQCGLKNAFKEARYPVINAATLIAANPDVVLLSSEPYPFSHKHLPEFKAMLPRAKVLLVDGEMFSWYGSRLLHAPDYFARLIVSLNS